jgi:hypothetical protein
MVGCSYPILSPSEALQSAVETPVVYQTVKLSHNPRFFWPGFMNAIFLWVVCARSQGAF